MLFSFSLIFLLGLLGNELFKKMKLPGFIGMIFIGMLIGQYGLDLIPENSEVSSNLKTFALVVILMRVGLSLDIEELKKVGRPSFLMCFVPALFEITGTIIFAPMLFGISYIEAAIMGTVLAAVSPAVVAPRMLKFLEEGYGTEKNIPQIILAGSSVDDVVVLILFSAFMTMYASGSFAFITLLSIPLSILTGLVAGILSGILLVKLFSKYHIRDTIKILIMFSISFIFCTIHELYPTDISDMLAVMSMSCVIYRKSPKVANRLSERCSKIWIVAEILLFVLVGCSVDIHYLTNSFFLVLILLILVLIIRMLGVFVCLIKTPLTMKEKLFCMISYTPKATVQAAIGGIPLAAGVASGSLILTVSVVAILVTAPLGSIAIDYFYKKLLTLDDKKIKLENNH